MLSKNKAPIANKKWKTTKIVKLDDKNQLL